MTCLNHGVRCMLDVPSVRGVLGMLGVLGVPGVPALLYIGTA